MEGYVVVLQPDAPQILLSGNAHFAHPASDFEAPEGIPLFPNLQITCSISHQVEAKKDENWHGTGEWSTGQSVRDKLEGPTRAALLWRKYSPCNYTRMREFTNLEARHIVCQYVG